MSVVHNVFHVLMLKKYVPDESHILDFTELGLTPNLTTVEWPVPIVDQEERVLRNRTISFVKVVWQYHGGDSATWEHEDLMRNSYPHLFGKCDLFCTLHCSLSPTFHTRSPSFLHALP